MSHRVFWSGSRESIIDLRMLTIQMGGTMERFTVAATQMSSRYLDVEHNIEAHRRLIRQTAEAGCQLVAFPELSMTGHNSTADTVRFAEPNDGRMFRIIAEEARRHNVVVAYGFAELYRGTHYNTYSIVGPDGLIGMQRKIHASYDEFFRYRQAYEWGVFDLGFCKTGVAICHDSEYWESWRILALKGAEVVLLPHAIRKMLDETGALTFDGDGKEATAAEYLENQRQMYEARPNPKLHDVMARTNGLFGIFSDHVGFDGHSSHVGCAYAIDPAGHMLAHADPCVGDAWVACDLDPEMFHFVRRNPWFQLKKRRPETYGELVREL
jgi:predicted amidohydrolase